MSYPLIFDYDLLRKHRLRALAALGEDSLFLWEALANRLVDRLQDIRREFPLAVNIGVHHGGLTEKLTGKFGIKRMISVDDLPFAKHHYIESSLDLLSIKPASIDLMVSLGHMHWVNDLPGLLAQIKQSLKPDGVFIGMLSGGDTLMELRQSLMVVETKHRGGVSARVSPMLSLQDASNLMQRAGFALPVVDMERISISYQNIIRLLHDLRAMGQTNALMQRSKAPLTKMMLQDVLMHYYEHFPHPEGGAAASFDIITMIGWAPHSSQTQSLRRGSGTVSLKDYLH